MEPTKKVLTITELVDQADAEQREHTRQREERERIERETRHERTLAAFKENFPEAVAMCEASAVALTGGENKLGHEAIIFSCNGRSIDVQYSAPTTVWLDSTGWHADLLTLARFLKKKLME